MGPSRTKPHHTGEEGIRFPYAGIRDMTSFHDRKDFLLIGKMPSHNITVGAALIYVRAFIKDIGADVPNGARED